MNITLYGSIRGNLFYLAMKVKESKFRKFTESGVFLFWLLPSISLSGSKYDISPKSGEYTHWFQVEITWFIWDYTLLVEFGKRNDMNTIELVRQEIERRHRKKKGKINYGEICRKINI